MLHVSDGLPIAARPANRNAQMIELTSEHPIGFKAHTPDQIFLRERDNPGNWGLVLITRDPREAIPSQLARKPVARLPFGRMRKRLLRHKVRKEMSNYIMLLYVFRAFAGRPRLHLRFEHLVHADKRQPELARLWSAMSLNPNQNNIDELYDVAKGSQTSLDARREKLKAEIAQHLNLGLTLESVMQRCTWQKNLRIDHSSLLAYTLPAATTAQSFML